MHSISPTPHTPHLRDKGTDEFLMLSRKLLHNMYEALQTGLRDRAITVRTLNATFTPEAP